MADPLFPGDANLLIDIFLAENCMKMKKNWTEGDDRPSRPRRSATNGW